MTEQFYDDVADELCRLGEAATSENTGGWVYCVLIPERSKGGTWYFGTANDVWGGNLMSDSEEDAGDYKGHDITTQVPSDCDDATVVAAAILVGLWLYHAKEMEP